MGSKVTPPFGANVFNLTVLSLFLASGGAAFQRGGGDHTGYVRWQFEQTAPASAGADAGASSKREHPVRIEVECSVWSHDGKRVHGLHAPDERLSCKVSATAVTAQPALGDWPPQCVVSFDSITAVFEPTKGAAAWVATIESALNTLNPDTVLSHLRLTPPEQGADWQFSMDTVVKPTKPYPPGSVGALLVKSAALWSADQRFVEKRGAYRSGCTAEAAPEFPAFAVSPLLPRRSDVAPPNR